MKASSQVNLIYCSLVCDWFLFFYELSEFSPHRSVENKTKEQEDLPQYFIISVL